LLKVPINTHSIKSSNSPATVCLLQTKACFKDNIIEADLNKEVEIEAAEVAILEEVTEDKCQVTDKICQDHPCLNKSQVDSINILLAIPNKCHNPHNME
jgi:hypothetical protein